MPTSTNQKFPCPVCAVLLDVWLTKKNKPYVTCDPCGIQMFVRGPAGIAALGRLIERGEQEGLWDRLAEMDRRFRLTCPKCRLRFWIEPELIETSTWDGRLKGFRCPEENCEGVVTWKTKP